MPTITEMICTKCKVSKPLEEFASRPNRRNGREEQCKQCCYARTVARRKANPEQYKAQYTACNRRNWRNNKEKIRIHNKAYHIINPGVARSSNRKRRALKVENYHEPYKDIDVFERDNWVCGVCGQKINKRLKHPNPRSKSIDHIIAISAGGPDAPINLQPAHLRCNQNKGVKGSGQLRLIG